MPQPQAGIIPAPSPNALFLILRVREPATHGPAVAKVAAGVPSLVNEENGEELEIVRHSFPYGTVSESGPFFIAYTKTLDTPEKMLSRMMGTTGDGLHDHLMDYTQAVSGATFFAPSLEVLKSLGSR
jgi:putative iron-dependent peroxidase